jgi:hypothetical protein
MASPKVSTPDLCAWCLFGFWNASTVPTYRLRDGTTGTPPPGMTPELRQLVAAPGVSWRDAWGTPMELVACTTVKGFRSCAWHALESFHGRNISPALDPPR